MVSFSDEERTPFDKRRFFEDQILAARPDRFPVPEGEFVVPIGEADVKREGTDVDATIIEAPSLTKNRAANGTVRGCPCG